MTIFILSKAWVRPTPKGVNRNYNLTPNDTIGKQVILIQTPDGENLPPSVKEFVESTFSEDSIRTKKKEDNPVWTWDIDTTYYFFDDIKEKFEEDGFEVVFNDFPEGEGESLHLADSKKDKELLEERA